MHTSYLLYNKNFFTVKSVQHVSVHYFGTIIRDPYREFTIRSVHFVGLRNEQSNSSNDLLGIRCEHYVAYMPHSPY
jgi:hypothetical protein